MKITSVETIPINVPLKKGLTTKTAHGEHIDSRYVLVRVKTDSGIEGLGEATVAPRWSGETSAGCVAAVNEIFAPLMIGENPFHRSAIMAAVDRSITGNPFAKAAMEMALWDLQGKALGVPVYELLGGAVRTSIPMKMVVGAFPTAKALSLAEQFLDWGANCLKVKVGLDPSGDIDRVAAVRDLAGPDVKICIDANCGWALPQAREVLGRMERYDILFAEQPIGRHLLQDMASLRSSSLVPIMADESVFTLQDAFRVAASRAADILSIYPGKHGGIANTVSIARVASSADIVCHMGSNLELGIATAAMLHVSAAIPEVDSDRYPGDLLGPLYHEADMITEPLNLGPTAATVPSGPGLGVSLDEEQVARWHE